MFTYTVPSHEVNNWSVGTAGGHSQVQAQMYCPGRFVAELSIKVQHARGQGTYSSHAIGTVGGGEDQEQAHLL